MATYAIGDVQGCFDDLLRLVDKINFDKTTDTLWFCGDVINRGPKSLETLRFIKSLGSSAITVLGNHDLHFLAVTALANNPSKHDTFTDILEADDRDDLVKWLLSNKLFHHDSDLNISMVHAGVPIQWTIEDAVSFSSEIEKILQSDSSLDFFKHMYGNYPPEWNPNLTGWNRYRFITNVFTRMRYCDDEGRPDFRHKGDIGTQPKHLTAWFMHEHRRTKDNEIIFGHWSTLSNIKEKNIYAIDTGCLWAQNLTALRIDTKEKELISIECPNGIKPTTK